MEAINYKAWGQKSSTWLLVALIAAVIIFYSITCYAGIVPRGLGLFFAKSADTGAALKQKLAAQKNELYYPRSVERFYKRNGYKQIWIAPDTVKTRASEAMLMLDCTLQFGLNYADYHPKQLSYQKLNLLIQNFSGQTTMKKQDLISC